MTTINPKENGTMTLLRHAVVEKASHNFGNEKNSIQELNYKGTLTGSHVFDSNENLSKDNMEEMLLRESAGLRDVEPADGHGNQHLLLSNLHLRKTIMNNLTL